MAKTSKNAMKIKGTLRNYVCTWTYAVPLAQWSKEALLANIDLGIKYAVKQKIALQVKIDEANVGRSKGILEGMLRLANKDPEQLKIVAEICRMQNIRTEVQTEYIIHENGYMSAPEPPPEDLDDELEDDEDLEDEDEYGDPDLDGSEDTEKSEEPIKVA